MSEVFADAYYYIALHNPNDRAHTEARALTTAIDGRIVTTIWALMEFADALAAPHVRNRTHRFLVELASDENTEIIAEMEPWYARGLSLFGTRPDKSWSLTDCISFEVMKARAIGDALTGDRHFLQAGLRPLMDMAGV